MAGATARTNHFVVRVERMARAVQRLFASTEHEGRTLLRLTLDAGRGDRPADQPVRGYRRVEWIERALEPLRETLSDEQFERLVSALCLVVGWEAQIVLRDVRGLNPEVEERVLTWAARTLVAGMVAEAERH